MDPPTTPRRRACGAASLALAFACIASAPAAAAPDPTEAGIACERAVQRQLSAQAGRGSDVTFTAVPAVQENLSNESGLVLKGAGRRGAAAGGRTFTYSCNVDPRSADVVGVVVRETTPVAAARPAPPPGEPNLAELSPEACESSAVQALKRRWPLAKEITFDPNTRTFKQESAARAELRGGGRALLAPGAPTALFSYDCVIDPHDGQVLGTRISG